MLGGSGMADAVRGRKMPFEAKSMARLIDNMKVGMAARRGCWRPSPPFDSEMVAIA